MRKALLSIFILALFPLFIFAQQDTPINSVLASEIDDLNEQEDARTEEIQNMLGFSLPEYSDNPSYIITFKDPSPDKNGVEIDIDEKGYNKITSPYTLPALSIGTHVVKFRFNDDTGAVKVLDYSLTVIPRAPIPETPEIKEDSIILSGTALANSDVIFTLSVNAYNITDIITTNSDGSWSTTVSPQAGLAEGIYTFTAYTRKYGYASTLSAPITFTVGDIIQPDNNQEDKKEIYFSFKSISKDNIEEIFKTNKDLVILLASVSLLSIVLTIIFRSLIIESKSQKKIKEVETLIHKDSKQKEDGVKTLREFFGGSEDEVEEKQKVEKSKDVPEKVEEVKEEKKETIINKDVFLKKYKMIDPDDSAGKEVKKTKKIKISLTSKEEE